MIHVKDFLLAPTSTYSTTSLLGRKGATLGHGFIDYKPIFAADKLAGLKFYFVEQEGPFLDTSSLDAAKMNYEYLHAFPG
jgi:hypothetical protein